MNSINRLITDTGRAAVMLLALSSAVSLAQVPVDEQGNVISAGEAVEATAYETGTDEQVLLGADELRKLVGPVALYPDELLAIVLPASTYPLQVVQAARFLKDLETNPSLKPDEDWDDSIVALVNYPEVVTLLNDDLDWTWRLGDAVVNQQNDVLNAVEDFRDQAYNAGNLKSDEYQNVARNDDVIEITPVSEEVIYVPYYEPERVVVYQPRPVYYYYPRPYPVYYYPYPAGYSFASGYFWGVTTAFTIGWRSSHLRVFHPSYYGHPYYGYNYRNDWWYRRPSIGHYNRVYINRNINQVVVNNHYAQGDAWRSRNNLRLRHSDRRITSNRYYPNGQPTRNNTAVGRSHTRSNSGVAVRPGHRSTSDRDSVRRMRDSISRNRETRVPATTGQRQNRPQALSRRGDTPAATSGQRQQRNATASKRSTRTESGNSVRQMRETIANNRLQRGVSHRNLARSRDAMAPSLRNERSNRVPRASAPARSSAAQSPNDSRTRPSSSNRATRDRAPAIRQSQPRASRQAVPQRQHSIRERAPVTRQSQPRVQKQVTPQRQRSTREAPASVSRPSATPAARPSRSKHAGNRSGSNRSQQPSQAKRRN